MFMQAPLATDTIAALLNMDTFRARIVLESFHPMIDVPTANSHPVTNIHPSFLDFIVYPSHCEKHLLKSAEGHRFLTVKCLHYLNQHLKHLTGNLDSYMMSSPSYKPNDIHDSLQYSCLHKASHLVHTLEGASSLTSVFEVQDILSKFVNYNLLRWFDWCHAFRHLESGVKSIDKASSATSVSTKSVGNKNINIKHSLRPFRACMVDLRVCHNSFRTLEFTLPGLRRVSTAWSGRRKAITMILFSVSETTGPEKEEQGLRTQGTEQVTMQETGDLAL
jgi:hypothetical protein